MRYLALLFIVFSAFEIGLLVLSGNLIGFWPTIGLIILTGVIGASLAKKQGAQVLRLAQVQIRNGDLPSEAILDGICVLLGAVMLITPGFLSDTCGFLLLIPWTRAGIKIWMSRWLWKKMRQGSIQFFTRKN
ncbi:MAG TPA: FxsA family protein [Bacillales bacterium]|nr:FxsA family protein [Bacillales bacterium]